MPCFHTIPAYKSRRVNAATGRRPVEFSPHRGYIDMPMELPCGRCVGCVQDRANEWALRCEHEAKSWSHNWFITLTYENLPDGGSLVPKDLQDFWKRLRKEYGDGIRYFACGEYGENYQRPHYHALVFNWLPRDVESHIPALGTDRVYSSKDLERIWGLGRVDISPFSGATAQYVTNYVRKNFSVGGAPIDFGNLVKPFQVMSRRPGIGKTFVERFLHDIYPDGYVTRPGGTKRRAPRFYDLTLEKMNARLFRKVKRRRADIAKLKSVDMLGSRMYTVEEVLKRKQEFFAGVSGRKYEKA